MKSDEPTTIEHALDHFDHVVKLVGVEHVGVGSDMDLDGYDDMPPEENKKLRAGYKGGYGFREKIEQADGPSHWATEIRSLPRIANQILCKGGEHSDRVCR